MKERLISSEKHPVFLSFSNAKLEGSNIFRIIIKKHQIQTSYCQESYLKSILFFQSQFLLTFDLFKCIRYSFSQLNLLKHHFTASKKENNQQYCQIKDLQCSCLRTLCISQVFLLFWSITEDLKVGFLYSETEQHYKHRVQHCRFLV